MRFGGGSQGYLLLCMVFKLIVTNMYWAFFVGFVSLVRQKSEKKIKALYQLNVIQLETFNKISLH
jgi:hypothetical protein